MSHNGADAHHRLDAQIPGQRLLDSLGNLMQVTGVGILPKMLDHGHVRFADGQHKISLLVGVQPGDHIHSGHVGRTQLAHQNHRPGRLGHEMQLLGPDINVPQQNIIAEDILHKRGLVVLFLIIGLGPVESDDRHGADERGPLILPAYEGGIVKLTAPAGQRLEGEAAADHLRVLLCRQQCRRAGPLLPNAGKLIAGHHRALFVDDPYSSVGTILHLKNDALENPAGHCVFSFLRGWQWSAPPLLLILHTSAFLLYRLP